MSTTQTMTIVIRPRRRRRGTPPEPPNPVSGSGSGSGSSPSSPVIMLGGLQPRLQHYRRRDLVDDGSAVGAPNARLVEAALGGDRGEPLVVRDHLDARSHRALQLLDLGLGGAGGRALGPRKREREADHDGRDLVLLGDLEDGAVVGAVIVLGAAQHRVRRRDGSVGSESASPMRTDPRSTPNAARKLGVGDRARHGRAFIAPRSWSARERVATPRRCRRHSGRPRRPRRCPLPTPPPSAFAAGRAIASAETPRSVRSLLTATAMPAFTPSGPVPASATTPEPSARTVSCARRRSSSLLRPS